MNRVRDIGSSASGAWYGCWWTLILIVESNASPPNQAWWTVSWAAALLLICIITQTDKDHRQLAITNFKQISVPDRHAARYVHPKSDLLTRPSGADIDMIMAMHSTDLDGVCRQTKNRKKTFQFGNSCVHAIKNEPTLEHCQILVNKTIRYI